MAKELRQYQEDCINAIIAAHSRGVSKCLNVMATGLGKTLTTIKLIERMKFNRVLWLSDRETLVNQSGIAFLREVLVDSSPIEKIGYLEWIKQTHGVISYTFKMGAIKSDLWEPDGNIIMGSLQTVNNRLHLLPPDYFDCIIADEAHGYCSPTAVKTLAHFKPSLLCGLTASPFRLDGLPLSDVFQEIVYEYDISQGIKDGYLCELEGIRIKTNISLDKVKTLGGEFNQGSLEQEVNIPERNRLILESFIKYCGDRKGIGYAVNIKHAVELARVFNEAGIKTIAISSNEELTPDSQQKIKDYSNGKYQVIWNVGMLIAGYDDKDTGVIIEARPTKSLTFFLQSVGRGTRLKPDEYVAKHGQKCIILDVVDNTTKHNLVNTWSLDKGKKTEDRIFTTKEQKEAVLAAIEARKATMLATRDKDEIVNLLQIPKLKISKFYTMSDDATQAQLDAIEKFGYDKVNVHYTKLMITEIFAAQPCTPKMIGWLKYKGYDVSAGIPSRGEFEAARKEVERKEETAARKERDKIVKKNMKPYMGNRS